ncbi:MAG: YciI family protein [Terriglobales bacterium]
MKYLCLIFYDEEKLLALPEQEIQTLADDALDYDDVLRQSGHFVAAQALQSVHAASTLRMRNGKTSVTEGPFAETNEQIGGFVLIEAKDLNQAIQVASRLPRARLGGVEVRPILQLSAKRPE